MEKVLTDSKMAEWKNFGKPDEVREFPKGRLELIKIGGATIGRGIFEPGWRWSTSVQPLAKTQVARLPIFSIMYQAPFVYEWMMELNLTASRAMYHFCPQGMMPGL